jgi:hypothetical protein
MVIRLEFLAMSLTLPAWRYTAFERFTLYIREEVKLLFMCKHGLDGLGRMLPLFEEMNKIEHLLPVRDMKISPEETIKNAKANAEFAQQELESDFPC